MGRTTPFETRGDVALLGTFGYELDITKLTEEEKEQVKCQVEKYHKYNDLIREGDYYRLASAEENGYYDSWMIADKDRSRALVFYVQVRARANAKSRFVRLAGLDEKKCYAVDGTVYAGSALMQAGVRIPAEFGDFKSRLIEIAEV